MLLVCGHPIHINRSHLVARAHPVWVGHKPQKFRAASNFFVVSMETRLLFPGSTEFLENVQKNLSSQLLNLPEKYSISQLLNLWVSDQNSEKSKGFSQANFFGSHADVLESESG